MPNAPISTSWFAEKSSMLVEQLARAVAVNRHVEDVAVRDLMNAVLETALKYAMTITTAGLYEREAGPGNIAEGVASDPEKVLPWLSEVRKLDENQTARNRLRDGVVREVERTLEEFRISRS